MEEKNEERVEEVKEPQSEAKNGNKMVIVIILLVSLTLLGGCGYLLLKSKVEEEDNHQVFSNYIDKKDLEVNIKNEDNEKPNEEISKEKDKETSNTSNSGVKTENKKEYKSKDGKYTFRLVDRSELKPADDADVGTRTAPYYAYLNDHPVGIEKIIDDGKGVYYTYKGWFYETAGSSGVVSILVDSRDNTLIVCPYAKSEHAVDDEVYYLFSTGIDGLSGGLTALNINVGEFFIRYMNSPEGANLLYTKDWKELGWIGTPQYDDEGVYVFNNYLLDGAEAKYDASGRNVQEKSNKGLKIVVDRQNDSITLDFDKIENDLIAKVDGYKTDVVLRTRTDSHCNEGSSSPMTKKNLGISEISKVISKLREAKKVIWLLTSRECVLYSFSVGSDFVAFEADDPTVMLVGINGEGFAFHYDESVIDFFKSL